MLTTQFKDRHGDWRRHILIPKQTLHLNGEAFRPDNIETDFVYFTETHLFPSLGDGWWNGDERRRLVTWLRENKTLLANAWTPGGRRSISVYRSFLGREMGVARATMERVWPTLANALTGLYAPKGATAVIEQRPIREAGEGIWEPGGTCFGDGRGCNCHNKFWLDLQPRALLLGLTYNEEPGGRCFAYFMGNRSIYLFNFYWCGTAPQNRRFYATALAQATRSTFTVSERTNFEPPVYINGGSLLVTLNHTSGRGRRLTAPDDFRYRCICGRTYHPDDGYMEEDGTRVFQGCSDDCAEDISGVQREVCERCGTRRGNIRHHEGMDQYLCEDCRDNVTQCSSCGYCSFDSDDLNWIEGHDAYYCDDCVARCEQCDTLLPTSDLSTTCTGYEVCDDCRHICDHCGQDFIEEELTEPGLCEQCAKEAQKEADEEAQEDADAVNAEKEDAELRLESLDELARALEALMAAEPPMPPAPQEA